MTKTVWSYRVVKRSSGPGKSFYRIHTVYGHPGFEPHSIAEEAGPVFGETIEELQSDMRKMQRAFDLPILNYEDF